MKVVVRNLFFFILFFAFFFLFSQNIQAADEFFTKYDVTYEATLKGKLKVTQNVTLTNKLSDIYATDYSFNLEKALPENISASDSLGPLQVESQVQGETAIIKLHFNEQVVGKEKTLQFTLSYELTDAVHFYGQVREVTLPKLSPEGAIDEYEVSLKVPQEFGKVAYISPSPKSQKSDGSFLFFSFSKDQLISSGIIAAFGKFQFFNFVLNYHLENPTSGKIKTKIAFPPDTSYQKMIYQKINPEPLNMEVDADGNWLGTYLLKPKEKLEILAYGQAKIFAYPQFEVNKSLYKPEILTKYLAGQKYWEVDDSEIKKISQNLKTPKQIFDYVVTSLDYDYSRVREGAQRMGALGVLKNPKRAICMEFTDLFITLSRAAGIPAREVNGFSYTDNPLLQPLSLVQDVLHAWPEYWDFSKKTWVQIDPTWQNTTGGIDYFSKLDLGHFVFVIHGMDSESPPPAGAYKDTQNPKKDIQISFGESEQPAPSELKVDFKLPLLIATEKATSGKIIISNAGGEAINNLEIALRTKDLNLLTSAAETIDSLPPYSQKEIPVSLKAPGFFSRGAGKVIVVVSGQEFVYNLRCESILLTKILPIFFGLIIFVGLGFLIKRIKNDKQNTKITKRDSS